MLVTSCAVGPDFLHPAPPEITRYAREPLTHTSSTDVASGRRQVFAPGGDIPEQWWALFRSPRLNALIEQALHNNQSLQSALASLRAAKEAVYAQEGKFFPLAQANFNPTRQHTSSVVSPVLSNPNVQTFNLVTAQLEVSYTFDVWGLNRRTVESLEALSDVQRFQAEAAYLSLTANLVVAVITEASLRGQIEATEQIIAINEKMLETIRRQFETGFANRNDLALQEAALAQARATLPPLRKALAQARDLIAALAGTFPTE